MRHRLLACTRARGQKCFIDHKECFSWFSFAVEREMFKLAAIERKSSSIPIRCYTIRHLKSEEYGECLLGSQDIMNQSATNKSLY